MSGVEGRSPRRKHRAAAARLRPRLRPPSHVAIRPPYEASSDVVSTCVMCTHTIYGAIAHLHYCKTVSENRVAISDQQQNRGMISHSKIPRSSICLKLRRGSEWDRGAKPPKKFPGAAAGYLHPRLNTSMGGMGRGHRYLPMALYRIDPADAALPRGLSVIICKPAACVAGVLFIVHSILRTLGAELNLHSIACRLRCEHT